MKDNNIVIAVPTYNRVSFLIKLLKSIPKEIEIFVSDNGNYVPEDMKENYSNTSFTMHENIIGMFSNWNSAIENSRNGRYIAITSDDDLYLSESFKVIEEAINRGEDADVYIFGNNFINEHDEIIGSYCPDKYEVFQSPQGLKHFLSGVDARMPSIFFKKTFLDEIGYFDDKKFKITAADSELVQRALFLGKSVYVPEIVSSYRVWEGSATNETIASLAWMTEIELWADKILTLGKEARCELYDWDKYKDEIFARNLLAGLSNLYSKHKYKELCDYFNKMRFPVRATARTKLKIYKYFCVAKVRGILGV